MLNLTKYQQKINKTMVVFANYVFAIWLKKLLAFIIFGNKTKKITALFVAIFGIILLLWQFHFKEVLSDTNPPYLSATNTRKDAFPASATTVASNVPLESPIASSSIKIDRLGYTLTKLYYPNGVDYFRCANQTEKANLQYYCDASLLPNNDLAGKNTNCTSSPSFCTEEQVFSFQTQKRESFYKRSPGEKIIRLVKEYHSSQETILTDYRIAYLPPYNQFSVLSPTDSNGVLSASSTANPSIKILSGSPPAPANYTGRVSNLPACKAGATLLDIGNTCMLKIKINDSDRSKIATNNFDFSDVSDYCHEKNLVEPILGENCRLPACLSISKEYYRRPGINCLADCNAIDIFGGNGIDDANLKYPGINCLPACETGLKTVLYSSSDLNNANALFPKDIGASCFLKHQGYVMPVCNNTPLVGFPDNSHSQQTIVIESATIAKNPPVPRKDCMNASDLPLCAFFSDKGASIANKFGCLGMVKQTIAGSDVFVDNQYVLGVNEINKTSAPQYDENKASGQSDLKNIPIIDYAPLSCSSTSVGCGKPYTYSKLAQKAYDYSRGVGNADYDFNVDMIEVQDTLNHDYDSLNESDTNSLRLKPFANTDRPLATSAPPNVFHVNNANYKIKATLDPYYTDLRHKPSCSLLTKQELKFVGTRNCDLNQIWSDTNGGKNSVADMQNGVISNNGKFCQGEYFCKVDTRCSMFSDEQLQEAKAFFHCLPAQYTSYEESKSSDDIKCNALNDLEILALTKTTIDSSVVSAPKLELNELNNFITKACFRGNLGFLIHKRNDHNIGGVAGDSSGYNLPDYTKMNSAIFYDEGIVDSIDFSSKCGYLNFDTTSRVDYMFQNTTISAVGTTNYESCLHSNQLSCKKTSYKKACYLLGSYRFNDVNAFFKRIVEGSTSDSNITNAKPASCTDYAQDCEINYALNTLGTLDCFTDSTIAPTETNITEIRKCNVDPLLLAVFVPHAKSINGINDDRRYKPLTINDTDCHDCFCDSINTSNAANHRMLQAKYEASGGLVSDFQQIINPCNIASSCFICYKPNVYEGLIQNAYTERHGTAIKYYPLFTITPPERLSDYVRSATGTTDNGNTMGYYQYEDPFYSWFFFPKPNMYGSKATQTVRDCGDNKKCYKAFTVDFPNSRNNNGNGNGQLDEDREFLDYKTFPPIYYYGNGNFGDDAEKEKYNLVSSPEGLDSGVIDRIGTHSINKIASPSATALRGASTMGDNAYGVYNYSSSFDREWLCGMNRNVGGGRLPDEDTFAYFAPVLVKSGRFGLKPNNRYSDNRRFAFSDVKWNGEKLEYHVNICLRYESAWAPGACGRRECRIDNPSGMMWCGEDQCRKFIVQEPEIGEKYSKCHLLYPPNMANEKRQPAWFVNNLKSLVGKYDPISLYENYNDEKINEGNDFLDTDNGLASDYYKCAKLYSGPALEHSKKTGKGIAAAIVGLVTINPLAAAAVATSAVWNYTDHRVRAFYDSGHVCAELDFYGIDLDTYSRNKEDMNNAKSFELPNGGKICYGGRVLNGGNCEFANGSFNTFVNLDTNIGGMPGATDPTVWRVVRKIKFVGNVSDDANVSFLGYSVPDVTDSGSTLPRSTHLKYNRDTQVQDLFPHQISANRGVITMTYDHDARMSKLREGGKVCEAGNVSNCDFIFDSNKSGVDKPSGKNPAKAIEAQYGLRQLSRGKKNPYYGFNGYKYDDANNPIGNWRSSSFPDGWNLCFLGMENVLVVSLAITGSDGCPILASLAREGQCPFGSSKYLGSDCNRDKNENNIADNNGYVPDFMPDKFLKEKVWLKSDCVPVQRRVGLPLTSSIATPDNAPNLFSPEPIVFAVKVNNIWKKATEIQENVDKVDFSDPEIVLKYGDKYYYLKLPNQHASLVRCHPTTISRSSDNVLYSFNNTGSDNDKFILQHLFGFVDENDLLERLEQNSFTANQTSGGLFSDDTTPPTSFKIHHNPNLDGSRDSALSNISTICDSNTQPNSITKPYGVMISSQLNFFHSGDVNVPLYAQIFVKKEQKEGLPVLCVYRGSVENDKPAVVLRDSDLKNVACFSRKQPDLNKMQLIKENSINDPDNLFLDQQVQFQYKYSGATFEDIAEMFTTQVSSSVSEKYSLKTTADSLSAAKNTDFIEDISYFEGMQISSARHVCTALNLDCVDNEREIQKICNTNKLICNRSTVVTKQDFSELNMSINNNNYVNFSSDNSKVIARSSLFRMLEVRGFCLGNLLSYCNNLNGYTFDDIKAYPKINTLHPNFNNRIGLDSLTLLSISDSAKNTLGWNNKICLKQGVQNIMSTNQQWVKQITTGLAELKKGKRDNSVLDNYNNPPSGNIRPAEPHEYKPNLTGTPNLCVEIGGGSVANPKLVDFCEASSYPLEVEKYKNFNTNFVNKIDLIQQGNIRYQGLIGTDYSQADSGVFGIDISHKNRKDGIIIASNTQTANAEIDVSFKGDSGIYGVCNGFWKNTSIASNVVRYSCSSNAIQATTSINGSCERFSCPAVSYGEGNNLNQPAPDGLYPQNSNVIGLDVAKNRGYASWPKFTKTTDFIEYVKDTSECLVGFAKDGSDVDNNNCFDQDVCSTSTTDSSALKMLTAICPKSSGATSCSESSKNVYNNAGKLPSTYCNQFGYWRFDWSEEFRKAHIQDGLNAGETVLNSCQRIKCSITDLEDKFKDDSSINKTPVRLIKQKCNDDNTIIVAELNKQEDRTSYINKYYYLKTSNLAGCKTAQKLRIVLDATQYLANIPPLATTFVDITIPISASGYNKFDVNDNTKVIAWYFKVISTNNIDESSFTFTTEATKATAPHEKLLKVWSRIAGFQPNTDTRTSIPAMRHKTTEHAKIGGEKTSLATDDDDYDTEGKCLASLGYRAISAGINPKLMCNYQGILKVKQPCVSTCDAVDDVMANNDSHGYAQWADTENKIKICGERCSPAKTKIPFSYVSKSVKQGTSPSVCVNNKKPYPYPPFRSSEGVKFEFIDGSLSSLSVQTQTINRDPNSTQDKDLYSISNLSSCLTGLNGCVVEFDKANISENVKLLSSGSELNLYKKDSVGGQERFTPYDILPNVKYKITQIPSTSDYYVALLQSKKLTEDTRWQEYNINKRKIFSSSDCSLTGSVINCSCGAQNKPLCPFENVGDKISEDEVVEINLSSNLSNANSYSLQFTKQSDSTSSISIFPSSAVDNLVLQMKKDSSGLWRWEVMNDGLNRLLPNTTFASSIADNSCTQTTIAGSPSSDYNCTLTVTLTPGITTTSLSNNQEIKINFGSMAPAVGNSSDNYKIKYNNLSVKKYNSQGNLIDDFNYQELSGEYILRAIYNGINIDYYLLINAEDFKSEVNNSATINNYPTPSRTCRYGIGNVWSLPDSACQNSCPGLNGVVSADGDKIVNVAIDNIINSNDFDSRIGSAITEHKIKIDASFSSKQGDYLLVYLLVSPGSPALSRNKIAVKVVNVDSVNSEATLHVIWPQLDYNRDVTLILQKYGNTYKIIQGNPDLSGNNVISDDPSDVDNTNPFSAQHYETDGIKNSIILYRRCGSEGKWQDPISLCPIAGPAKGKNATGLNTINSILGFVSDGAIEPGGDHSPTIESVRASTNFDFSIARLDNGVLKQTSLQKMSDVSSYFYRLADTPSNDSISEIPVIPDYRIGGSSDNKFSIWNYFSSSFASKNIYAYAMCNYNYAKPTNTYLSDENRNYHDIYYNFYNSNFARDAWGTNQKYQCQSSADNYLNTYKIAPALGSSPCLQQCNSGIIKRVGVFGAGNVDDDFGSSTLGGIDYSIVPPTATKAYFVNDAYAKYNKLDSDGIYDFHLGLQVQQNPIFKVFSIFGSIAGDNCATMSNSKSGRCNLFENENIPNTPTTDNPNDVVLESQCSHQAGSEVMVSATIGSGGSIVEQPRALSKYCWGLTRGQANLNPHATCEAGGKFGLNNPFIGKKKQESTIFKYNAFVGNGSQVGRHEISNGIVKEIFFNYGDLRIENSGGGSCAGKAMTSMCDSHFALFKENEYNYDNTRRLDELQWGQIEYPEGSYGVCSCWDAIEHYSVHRDFGNRTTSYHINLFGDNLSLSSSGNSYFQNNLCRSLGVGYDATNCIGFTSAVTVDPEGGAGNILNNNTQIIAPGHYKSLLIIMWGCPNNYSTTYDYNANKCTGSSGSSFKPSGFYPDISATK